MDDKADRIERQIRFLDQVRRDLNRVFLEGDGEVRLDAQGRKKPLSLADPAVLRSVVAGFYGYVEELWAESKVESLRARNAGERIEAETYLVFRKARPEHRTAALPQKDAEAESRVRNEPAQEAVLLWEGAVIRLQSLRNSFEQFLKTLDSIMYARAREWSAMGR